MNLTTNADYCQTWKGVMVWYKCSLNRFCQFVVNVMVLWLLIQKVLDKSQITRCAKPN
jgi:hypothetical protein